MVIYLNVGGYEYQTTVETLQQCSYFQGVLNLQGGNFPQTSKEEPYFIDHDGKGFRHLLNFLRNPDYSFPEKYAWILPFWGFTIEDTSDRSKTLQGNVIKTHAALWDENQGNPYIESPAGVAVQYTVFHRSIPAICTLDGYTFDKFPWIVTLPKSTSYYRAWLLLPSNIPEKDFHLYQCLLTCNSEISYSHTMDLTLLDDKPKKCAGWWYLPIKLGIFNNNPYTVRREIIHITLLKSGKCDIPSQLRLETSEIKFPNPLYNSCKEDVVTVYHQHNLENSRIVNLKAGYLRYLIWKVDKVVPNVVIKNNVKIVQQVSRGDFQYLEREKRELSKLEKGAGAIYYCMEPHNARMNTGGLQIDDNALTFEFPEKVTGTLWQCTFDIILSKGDYIIPRNISQSTEDQPADLDDLDYDSVG